jgi:hypothetical protein
VQHAGHGCRGEDGGSRPADWEANGASGWHPRTGCCASGSAGTPTDGTVEGFNSGTTALPHLFQLLPVGFDKDAVTAVREQIDYQLARS